jgi:hypothetical protein
MRAARPDTLLPNVFVKCRLFDDAVISQSFMPISWQTSPAATPETVMFVDVPALSAGTVTEPENANIHATLFVEISVVRMHRTPIWLVPDHHDCCLIMLTELEFVYKVEAKPPPVM